MLYYWQNRYTEEKPLPTLFGDAQMHETKLIEGMRDDAIVGLAVILKELLDEARTTD